MSEETTLEQPTRIVYDSLAGRYSDSPRALYEWLRSRVAAEHVWLADPQHRAGFPADVRTVRHGSAESIAALEAADLVVGNTHIDLDWTKTPSATYVQTWHGTPLKTVHNDVLWAPPGRLAELDRDIVRWDYLLSPNVVSTARLRQAFGYTGKVLEYGYPRNDLLLSPGRAAVRARVRASLGLCEDETAVLYAPTYRDQQYFDPAHSTIELALNAADVARQLGPRFRLLPRLHYFVTSRGVPQTGPGVVDVSYYPDIAELHLAADVLVTDYSSTMFDFAVTGKPLLFYTYDLAAYRDHNRGFYFDLEPVAPGPVVSTQADLVAALRDLPALTHAYADRYRTFRQDFCALEDGSATERLGRFLLQRVRGLAPPPSSFPRVQPGPRRTCAGR